MNWGFVQGRNTSRAWEKLSRDINRPPIPVEPELTRLEEVTMKFKEGVLFRPIVNLTSAKDAEVSSWHPSILPRESRESAQMKPRSFPFASAKEPRGNKCRGFPYEA